MFEFKSHEPIMREGQLTGYNYSPYAVFNEHNGQSVAVQGGKFWNIGGQEMPLSEIPDFVWSALDTLTDEYRQELGIDKVKRPLVVKKVERPTNA